MDVSIATVEQTFRDHDAARMIHGHTHRPAVHVHDVDGTKRERIVLADWELDGRYLEVSAAGTVTRTISA
jgi:UDP-2,3-diacylglucosamine hydrolase